MEVIGFTKDGYVVVTRDYIMWVEMLKAEIEKLRKLAITKGDGN